MTVSTGATRVQPTADHARAYASPRWLTEQPALLDGEGAVTVLRRRSAVPVGGLAPGAVIDGRRLVGARDLHDAPWWIPATVVWSDAEVAIRPEHPRPAGLAHDRCWSRAVLSGLSDRLGWEGRHAFERGETLATIDGPGETPVATRYDAGLGHDVPCVLLVSEQLTRWGAGSTLESAYRRALFGDHGLAEDEAARELADMRLVLADAGLDVAVVDVGTPMLRRAGLARVSVQLMGR
jgi:hypothetical protein